LDLVLGANRREHCIEVAPPKESEGGRVNN
jgi:hypothetical protein